MSNTSKAIPISISIMGFALVIGQGVGNVLLGVADSIVFDYTPLYVVGLTNATSAGIAITKRWKKQ